MNDRELLELAAKAVGLELEGDLCGNPGPWMPMYYEGKTYHSWDPLADDGDALRLAVKLGLVIRPPFSGFKEASATNPHDMRKSSEWETNEPMEATRRAIIRAAAEIGKSMP